MRRGLRDRLAWRSDPGDDVTGFHTDALCHAPLQQNAFGDRLQLTRCLVGLNLHKHAAARNPSASEDTPLENLDLIRRRSQVRHPNC